MKRPGSRGGCKRVKGRIGFNPPFHPAVSSPPPASLLPVPFLFPQSKRRCVKSLADGTAGHTCGFFCPPCTLVTPPCPHTHTVCQSAGTTPVTPPPLDSNPLAVSSCRKRIKAVFFSSSSNPFPRHPSLLLSSAPPSPSRQGVVCVCL